VESLIKGRLNRIKAAWVVLAGCGVLTLCLGVSWGENVLDNIGLESSASQLALTMKGSGQASYEIKRQDGQLHVIFDNTTLSPVMAARGLNVVADTQNHYIAQVVPLAQNKVKVIIPNYAAQHLPLRVVQGDTTIVHRGDALGTLALSQSEAPGYTSKVLEPSDKVLEGLLKQLLSPSRSVVAKPITASASQKATGAKILAASRAKSSPALGQVAAKASWAVVPKPVAGSATSALALAEPVSSGSKSVKSQKAPSKPQPAKSLAPAMKRPTSTQSVVKLAPAVALGMVPEAVQPSAAMPSSDAASAPTKLPSLDNLPTDPMSPQLKANPNYLSDTPPLSQMLDTPEAKSTDDTAGVAAIPATSDKPAWWSWMVWPIAAVLCGVAIACVLTGIWFFRRFMSEIRQKQDQPVSANIGRPAGENPSAVIGSTHSPVGGVSGQSLWLASNPTFAFRHCPGALVSVSSATPGDRLFNFCSTFGSNGSHPNLAVPVAAS
jgi:hypothetical protein